MDNQNARAWSQESVLRYYDHHRLTTKDIYPSEWFFLKSKLKNGIRVLDIGCAKGFIAQLLSENLKEFTYTGVDISEEMLISARKKFPQHRFLQVHESDHSVLGTECFDLVLCIGVLSIHETWRATLKASWQHTQDTLIFDLRETHLQTIEDKKRAYFKMNFDANDRIENVPVVPYNIINSANARETILDICKPALSVQHYGYQQQISSLATSPIQEVIANVYCIERDNNPL